MFYAGIGMIALGTLVLLYSIYYAVTQNIKKEMKEYRELATNSIDDDYEPPKPIERVYDKKPINSFIDDEHNSANILNDEEIDEIIGDINEEEEDVKEVEKDQVHVQKTGEEETSVLEEETSILDNDELEEETSILSESEEEGEEETGVLDEEDTSILKNDKPEFETITNPEIVFPSNANANLYEKPEIDISEAISARVYDNDIVDDSNSITTPEIEFDELENPKAEILESENKEPEDNSDYPSTILVNGIEVRYKPKEPKGEAK